MDSTRERFVDRALLREFLLAAAVLAACLAWIFRAPLLNGGVASLQQSVEAPPAALAGLSDMDFELQPALFAQSRQLKSGVFPWWSPDSQGGTPLLGKMQNGVFAPYHLPLYLFPTSWFARLFTAVALLKCSLLFAFAYLFARVLRLKAPAASLAAALYLLPLASTGQLYAWSGAAIFLPLTLLLTELFYRGRRRWAALLLPWAAALPFFAGYFESAVWIGVCAVVFFFFRLRGDPASARRKLPRAAGFLACLAAGAALAAVQLAPAAEYAGLSFNRVWHDPRWFLWYYETVGKVLTLEDAPALLAGLAALAGFLVLLRRAAASEAGPWSAPELRRRAAAALLLAAAVASLSCAGLDDSMSRLVQPNETAALGPWALLAALAVLALWEGFEAEDAGRRALGAVALVGLAAVLRVPLLSGLLARLPVFEHFHNTTRRWDLLLGLSVLAAAGLQRALALPARARARACSRLLSLTAVFAAGLLASVPLQRAVEAVRPLGPWRPGRPSLTGAFADRGGTTYGGKWAVAGWWPEFPPRVPPVEAVSVGYLENGRMLARTPAALSASGDRTYFRAEISSAAPGAYYVFAEIRRRGGGVETMIHPQTFMQEGGSVKVLPPRGGPRGAALIAGAALATPLVLRGGAPAAAGAGAALLALSAALNPALPALSADRIPYALGGIDALRADAGNFRVASDRDDFLHADYLDVYGLADLRTGGDNLDLLTQIYLGRLTRELLRDPANAAAFEAGLKLLGLGAVKYLVEPPDAKPVPGLREFYRGPDMAVGRNPFFRPRAAFYDRATVFPLESLDWPDHAAQMNALKALILSGRADPARDLVLDDAPAAPPAPGVGAIAAGAAIVSSDEPLRVRVDVDAPRPGFLFLADNDYPGWKAEMNGREARILRAWVAYRAVEVPAGRSVVEFSYRPALLWAAAALSALTAALLALAYALLRGPFDRGHDGGAAGAAELLVVGLVAPCLLYWSVWCAFAYRGGLEWRRWGDEGFLVNAAGAAAALALAAAGARFLRRPRR